MQMMKKILFSYDEFIFERIYMAAMEESWVIKDELYPVRNTHASFHATPLGSSSSSNPPTHTHTTYIHTYIDVGMLFGLAYTALTCFITKGREPWTFKNRAADSEKTEPAAKHKEIAYPKSDGVLSFDLLTNLQRSG